MIISNVTKKVSFALPTQIHILVNFLIAYINLLTLFLSLSLIFLSPSKQMCCGNFFFLERVLQVFH
jgi:hypothetical protein